MRKFASTQMMALALAICTVNHVAQVARCEDPQVAGLEGVDLGWLSDMRSEIDQQVERFSSAYSLTPEAQENLRAQLVSRLPQQWQFESKGFKAVQEQIDAALATGVNLEEDSAESKEIMEKFRGIGEIGPLNDLVVAKELESGLDPAVAEQGRARLVDLLSRRDHINSGRDDDFELQSSHNGTLADARIAAEAPLTPAGNPLPRGNKLIQVAPEAAGKVGGDAVSSTPVLPNSSMTPVLSDNAISATGAVVGKTDAKPDINEVKKAADALLADPSKTLADVNGGAANGRTAKAAAAVPPVSKERGPSVPPPAVNAAPVDAGRMTDKGAAPSRPMPAAVEAVRLQAAPPLDDWDKYVDTTCKKFGFTDAQVIKAQSILKDLRTRAAAYRTGRNDDFAAAERLTDAKAKADRKKELSAPIDAFFEELKQRLDNLATLEQRAKAAAPAPGKK